MVVVSAPQPFAEALQGLPPQDRHRIAEAAFSLREEGRVPEDIVVKLVGEPVDGLPALLPELLIHREMMIAVATGGRSIQEVDDYYGARQARIAEACIAAGIPYENPYTSLWDWYHYWKENFGKWSERRHYVRGLFASPIAAAAGRIANPSPVAEREPTGWERVDRCLARARTQLDTASSEEEWQSVGLLCREVLNFARAGSLRSGGPHKR